MSLNPLTSWYIPCNVLGAPDDLLTTSLLCICIHFKRAEKGIDNLSDKCKEIWVIDSETISSKFMENKRKQGIEIWDTGC